MAAKPVPTSWDPVRFRNWRQRHRLEAVVTSIDFIGHAGAMKTRRRARSDSELQPINVNARRNSRHSGVFQGPFNIRAAAARMLVEKIARDKRDVPSRRQTTLTAGEWVDGLTLQPVV